ncbi:MAG TPA: serine/threonine-protein kinase [Miltoncostaeaceae bacterium]|nr:serine/threonine-protein kinase [Miltoncostaeaceae bacterium]
MGPVIGRGAAARVYRARDLCTGDRVAVKEIPIDLDMARRAGAEVRAAARLSHPNVVRLLDWGEDHVALYLVSELVEGPNLAQVMRDGGAAAAPAALAGVTADVLEGLDHAHRRRIVHRDVKPANVLVDRDGRGRLADFGVARIAGEAGVTATGGLVGTVAYMAPEQASGDPVGPPADVYAACLVLYEGLTGRNPIAGGSPSETLRRAARAEIPPLARVRPDLPPGLCRAVMSGLDRAPERRPPALELARALRSEMPGLRRAVTPRSRLARFAPAVASGVLAGSIVAAVVAATTAAAPGAVALAGLTAGGLVAVAPWPALVVLTGLALAAGTRDAPGASLLLGVLALVLILPARRMRHAALVPALWPLAATLGLLPAAVAVTGALPSWRWRLWAAVSGVLATVAWQLLRGADPVLVGGRRLASTSEAVRDVPSPLVAAQELAAPLRHRPELGAIALVLVAAALAFPLVRLARPAGPRVVAGIAWCAVLGAAVVAAGGSTQAAMGALIPSCILVSSWAARPWRLLARRDDRRRTATLRGPSAERLPVR